MACGLFVVWIRRRGDLNEGGRGWPHILDIFTHLRYDCGKASRVESEVMKSFAVVGFPCLRGQLHKVMHMPGNDILQVIFFSAST